MTLFRPTAIPLFCAVAALAGCTSLSPEDIVAGSAMPESAAPVIEPDPPEVRLVAAIEEQGCVLTAQNVETILLAASLTQAELAEITPRLADAGRVEVAGSGAIRVNTEACA
jgi:hypothetical protein